MTFFNNRKMLLATTALAITLAPAITNALPTGGSVSSGSATIINSNGLTRVLQSTPDAVINWTGFNTSKGEEVSFSDQQGSNSVTLNRVSGGATTFNGALSSNGNVWVINPSGVLIGSTGTVNTAGFLATTSNITDANFMAGKYNFTPGGGASGASVSNAGTITVADTGLVGLVAPNIANSGTIKFTGNVINAKAGTIALASGDTFTVDLAGDGLINLAASSAVKMQSVTNSGTLDAYSAGHSGSVQLTAAQASGLVNSVINLNGIVEATNLTGIGDTVNYGAAFTPTAAGGSLALTAPGNITVANGSKIGAAGGNSVNVTLNSNATGSVNVNAAAITTNGGNLTVYAENPSNNQIIQNAAFNGTAINTSGGNVSVTDNGQFTAQNGSIAHAGNVNIFSGSESWSATNNAYGSYLNKFNIQSDNGFIQIEGVAPASPSASSYGMDILSSTLEADKGYVTLSGLSGPTTKGSSTGVNIYASDVFGTTGISINGTPVGLQGATVKGGSADGVVITQSVIGNSTTGSIGIAGTGGNAPGYASEGIVINNDVIASSGVANGPGGASSIVLNGAGGTGTNTIGIDASGGRADFELANTTKGGSIYISGYGGKSSGTGADAGVVFGGNVLSDIFTDNLTVTGAGGSGTNSVNGSGISLSAVLLEAANASFNGTGGAGTGTTNYGIHLAGGNSFYDSGTLNFTGTGTGSAADIASDESASSGNLNTVYLQSNSNFSFTGTRNDNSLKDLAFVLSE